MSDIRACVRDDIPAVAALFQKTFRGVGAGASPSLESCLRAVFLDHPDYDPDVCTQVHVDENGRIDGFIGVFSQRMQLRGRILRAAIASSLMVDDPVGKPMVGARLVKAHVSGPQDLSLAESANPIAYRMWTALGATPLPAYSMEWVRVFKPAATAVALASARSTMAGLLRPVAFIADAALCRAGRNMLALAGPAVPVRAADVGEEDLATILPSFVRGYALHPAWSDTSLRFVLAQARHKDLHGPLHRRVVYGRRDEPVGCYLYYGRPHSIAYVLQVLGPPNALGAVIDDLFHHAAALGCVAVRGRTQPELLAPLQQRKVVMLNRSSTVVHTRDEEIRDTVASGAALLVGLGAESWTPLIGGRFG